MARPHAAMAGGLVLLISTACGFPAGTADWSASASTTPETTTESAGQTTAQPTSSPSVYSSPLYGYSIALPAGWTATPATEVWDGNPESFSSGTPNVDLFVSSTGLKAWATGAPTTKNLADMVADQNVSDAANHPCPETPESSEPIIVAGNPASLVVKHCPEEGGILVAYAAVIHDGTGYFFYLQHPPPAGPPDDTADLIVLTGLLSGIELPPAG